LPTSPEPKGTANPTATAHPISQDTLIQQYSAEEPTVWGEAVPGVVHRLPTSDRVVALTLDACDGPAGSGYDAALIETRRLSNPEAVETVALATQAMADVKIHHGSTASRPVARRRWWLVDRFGRANHQRPDP
jgi:hypothetical protein